MCIDKRQTDRPIDRNDKPCTFTNFAHPHATLLIDLAIDPRRARRVAACVCPACAPQHTCGFCVCLCVQKLCCETAGGVLCVPCEWACWTDWPVWPCPDGSLAQLSCWALARLIAAAPAPLYSDWSCSQLTQLMDRTSWSQHLFLYNQYNFKVHFGASLVSSS